MSKNQNEWTKQDQSEAAKRGQGAEIGPEHGADKTSESSKPTAGKGDAGDRGTPAPEGIVPPKS